MEDLITITESNIHHFPFSDSSKKEIECYLDDNILNNLTRMQYGYNPEDNKVYSRSVIKNSSKGEWKEASHINFTNN